jgi:DNA-binding PadR family transcriptional regulator
MIEHELILLGLLKEGPKHGYEIKVKINEILSLFTGVNVKSIYYPLRILEQKKLVAQCSRKSGRRPERFVYELTEKGQARFFELLNKSFLDFRRPQFTLDLSLYFLHYMKPHLSRRRLRARMRILKGISLGLTQMVKAHTGKKPSSLGRILEHNLQMIGAELRFLSQISEEI